MDNFTKNELFDEMDSLKKWNQQMLEQIKSFRELGEHTVDVDMRMNVSESLAKRAEEEVFTRWKIWRFKHGRADPLMLSNMESIGAKMSEYFLEAGQAWKFPDSQYVRDNKPKLFRKREIIEGQIRDNLFTIKDMHAIAQEYQNRYGAHKHIITDRGFSWLQIILGFVLGVASSVTVTFILRTLDPKL